MCTDCNFLVIFLSLSGNCLWRKGSCVSPSCSFLHCVSAVIFIVQTRWLQLSSCHLVDIKWFSIWAVSKGKNLTIIKNEPTIIKCVGKLFGIVIVHYHRNSEGCFLFKCYFTLICVVGWELRLWVMVLCVKGSRPGNIHCGWMFLLAYLQSSKSELCACCEC